MVCVLRLVRCPRTLRWSGDRPCERQRTADDCSWTCWCEQTGGRLASEEHRTRRAYQPARQTSHSRYILLLAALQTGGGDRKEKQRKTRINYNVFFLIQKLQCHLWDMHNKFIILNLKISTIWTRISRLPCFLLL